MFRINVTSNDLSFLINFVIILSLAVVLFIKITEVPDDILWFSISIGFTLFLLFEFSLACIAYKPVGDRNFTPKVSLIVPVKNEEEVIYKTIQSAAMSNYPKNLLEIIVVNDGSTDRTAEELERAQRDFNIKVISLEKNMGKRKAIVAGFKEARGDIIAIMDSDTFLTRDALYNAVQYFSDDLVGAVCGNGRAYNRDQNILTKMQDAWYYGMFNVFKASESVFGMVTCCSGILSLYRRKAIEGLIDRWADEKLLGVQLRVGDDRALTNLVLNGIVQKSDADDRLLTVSVSRKGWLVVLARNAEAYTIVPSSVRKFIKQQIRWKKGWLRGNLFALTFMWRKHPIGAFLYYINVFLTLLMPAIIARTLYSSIFCANYKLALIYLAGIAYVGACYALNQAITDKSGSWKWRIPFQLTYHLFISPLLSVYAWLTLKKESWMTR